MGSRGRRNLKSRGDVAEISDQNRDGRRSEASRVRVQKVRSGLRPAWERPASPSSRNVTIPGNLPTTSVQFTVRPLKRTPGHDSVHLKRGLKLPCETTSPAEYYSTSSSCPSPVDPHNPYRTTCLLEGP